MKELIKFELRKILTKRLTLVALAVLLGFSVLLAVSSFQSMHAFDGVGKEGSGRTAVEIDQSIAAEYQGVLTDEKVQQMMKRFKPAGDLHGMNPVYLYQNAMQSAVFFRFSDLNGNWNGLYVSDVFGDEEIMVGYTSGWLSASRNMMVTFVVLSLVMILMIAPVFSGEYGGVDKIILASRYGKTKCGTAKVAAALLAALLATALVAAVNLGTAFALYGGDGLDSSILFSSVDFAEGGIPFNITCGELLGYQILLAFTGAVSVTGITLLLSALCKGPLAAFAASAALYLLPALLPVTEASALFRWIVLTPFYQFLCSAILSVEQMSSGALYGIWAAPTALVIFAVGATASRRIFAAHQVS